MRYVDFNYNVFSLSEQLIVNANNLKSQYPPNQWTEDDGVFQ